jgi:L-lactate utilization protein LutC
MAVDVAPNKEFEKLASDEQIERTRKALEANGIHVRVAETGEEAKRMFFELVPDGSEVFLGASVTLEQLGIRDIVDKSGRFDSLRPKIFAMDRKTQAREIRKLAGAPDYAAGSVQAVTEAGEVMIVSKTGSQLGAYASSAGKVIWLVGAQKLVKDMEEGFRRIHEYCVPREEVHMQQLYHTGTAPNKILIVNGEIRPDRITMIIVKEDLGY